MLKSLDKQLLCELLLNNVFCLAFSSNFYSIFYLGLCIRYLCISGYFAGPWRWTFKYIFIIWNLEFSTYSTFVYNTMIIYTVRTTCLHVHNAYCVISIEGDDDTYDGKTAVTFERSELPWIFFWGTLFRMTITHTGADLMFLSRLGSTISFTNFGSHDTIVLYWILWYTEPCYKGSLLKLSHRADTACRMDRQMNGRTNRQMEWKQYTHTHTTLLLTWGIKMKCTRSILWRFERMGMNPSTDRWTDKVKPIYPLHPPPTSVKGGYNYFNKNSSWWRP